jgi:hypothetical protein
VLVGGAVIGFVFLCAALKTRFCMTASRVRVGTEQKAPLSRSLW